MSAKQFVAFKERASEQELDDFYDKIYFKKFSILVKAKYEDYNGNRNLRFFASKVYPYDAELEQKALQNRYNAYLDKAEISGVPGDYMPMNFGGFDGNFD